MPKLAANLSTLFTDRPLEDRFSAAAQAGFKGVEIQFPYELPAQRILELLADSKLSLVMFNIPAGDSAAGDRGLAANWDRRDEFRRGLDEAVRYAELLKPERLNLLAGASEPTPQNDLALLMNTRIAAEELGEEGFQLTIEPLNDMTVPNSAIPTSRAALDLISEIDRDNVSLQLDIWHASRMGEDPIIVLREHVEQIGHIQVADVPDRGEPGTGEVDWTALFHAIDASGYEGWVGLEYNPTVDTEASLNFIRKLGYLG